MLQRIQTIYLFAIFLLSSAMFFVPLASLINKLETIQYTLNFRGIFIFQPSGEILISSVWGLTILMVLIPIISLSSIFMFKKRIYQIRLSIINMVLMAGFYGLIFVYILTAAKSFNADWYLLFACSFPLINMVLNFMAIRAIAKDEALVKSLNRLR